MPKVKPTVLKQLEISTQSNIALFALARSRGHRNSNRMIQEAIERFLNSPDILNELRGLNDIEPISQESPGVKYKSSVY